MKIAAALILILLFHSVFCHMPTLYEFCSNVIANGNTSHAKCDSSQCHGRPGKRGIEGRRGFPGIKGERGEPGTAEHLEARIKNLEDLLKKAENILKHSEVCYMGVKNRNIVSDSQITASSFHYIYKASDGRLDNADAPEGNKPAWAANRNVIGEWHQVDFGAPKLVGGIVTQGTPAGNQWVKSFKVSCGNTISTLTTIRENGSEKIFIGNTDTDTKVINQFPRVLMCRYVRVYPQSWKGWMKMRVEYIDGMCHIFQ